MKSWEQRVGRVAGTIQRQIARVRRENTELRWERPKGQVPRLLNFRQCIVLMLRAQGLSFKEIAKPQRVVPQRIQQMETEAIRKLLFQARFVLFDRWRFIALKPFELWEAQAREEFALAHNDYRRLWKNREPVGFIKKDPRDYNRARWVEQMRENRDWRGWPANKKNKLIN